MNRITVLIALVKGMLDGEETCSRLLRSADYQVVLESIEADAHRGEEAALAHSPPGETLQLLVRSVAEASDALDEIRSWLHGAKRVVVCDPYFFFSPTNASLFTSDAQYAKRMLQLFDADTKDIQIFCNGYTARMKREIWRPLKEGRRVRVVNSTEIHDRFIIKDGQHGKMIGASMQGFGGKIFAVLDLPAEDVTRLLSSLSQIARVGTRPWR